MRAKSVARALLGEEEVLETFSTLLGRCNPKAIYFIHILEFIQTSLLQVNKMEQRMIVYSSLQKSDRVPAPILKQWLCILPKYLWQLQNHNHDASLVSFKFPFLRC
jgi:hypothetical protein